MKSEISGLSIKKYRARKNEQIKELVIMTRSQQNIIHLGAKFLNIKLDICDSVVFKW
jgi:hypothetical protein